MLCKSKFQAQDKLLYERREIEILKVCDHPNIVKFIDSFEDLEYLYIVME